MNKILTWVRVLVVFAAATGVSAVTITGAQADASTDVAVELESIDGRTALLRVSCTQPVRVSISLRIQQETNSTVDAQIGSSVDCVDQEAVQWELRAISGRLKGGPANYWLQVFWPFNSFVREGTTTVRPLGHVDWPEDSSIDGTYTTIEIVGATRRELGIDFVVECSVPQTLFVRARAEQYVSQVRLSSGGLLLQVPCDGPTPLTIPFGSGRLVGGRAFATVEVRGTLDDGSRDEAEAAALITLQGRAEPLWGKVETDPESRITITEVTATHMRATIDCDGAGFVFTTAFISQRQGHLRASGEDWSDRRCPDGTLELGYHWRLWSGELRSGPVFASISVAAFERLDVFGDPVNGVWGDDQSTNAVVQVERPRN